MKRFLSPIAAALAFAALFVPGAAWALTVSPPTFDFSANPGDTITDSVRLRNEGSAPLSLHAEAVNFTATPGDETEGRPEFYSVSEERDGRGLAPWIAFDNADLTLLPGERGSIFYRIQVPKDASPGSYFGAVLITNVESGVNQGVGVIGNTAVLIILKVNGNAIEELKLSSFSAVPKVASSLPVEFEARVENGGTVHLRPFGDVVVRNLFGRTVAVVPINRLEYKSVLPGQARRYSAEWLKRKLPDGASTLARQWNNFALGPYTAEVSLEYGTQKKVLVASSRFWVIPWLALLVIFGGLAIVMLLVRGFLGWYKRRIIAQVEKIEKE